MAFIANPIPRPSVHAAGPHVCTCACASTTASARIPSPSASPSPFSTHKKAQPLSRNETGELLRRMLRVALDDQDFSQAARIRDNQAYLDRQEPTHALRAALDQALETEDFAAATVLRDHIDRVEMLRVAERAKPRFPMGLVVMHRRFGYRMLIFGVDFRCRAPRRKAEDAGVGMSLRGGEQPWYHAAVDERDKKSGDNIVYVAEDELEPAGAHVLIDHPITRIMFDGVHDTLLCPGFTCYAPASRDDDMLDVD